MEAKEETSTGQDEGQQLTLSQVSNCSLELSQNTVNQLIMAANNRSEGYNDAESVHSDCTRDRTPTPIPIHDGRTLTSPAHSTSSTNDNTGLPGSGSVSYQPTPGGLSPHHYPSPTPQQLYHHQSTSRTTPPPSTVHASSPVAGSMIGSPSCLHQQQQGQGSSYDYARCRIPSNVPFPGQYNFDIMLSDDEKPVPKTATFTYSSLTKRAYIRRDTIVGLHFNFSSLPPEHSIIRAMAIHKTPELVGEVLQCCPKHIDEQKRKFHMHPRHFVCGVSNNDAAYNEDNITGRLSVTYCTGTLQQKADNVLQALYTFPCFTSELHRGPGQLVQLIFTLEIGSHIVGRAVLDTRVCASPGRDRDNDEAKLSPVTAVAMNSLSLLAPVTPGGGASGGMGGEGVLGKKGRKRSSSTVVDGGPLPSKMIRGEAGKEKYTAKTFPDLFPFIDVCISMMEKVYQQQLLQPAQATINATPVGYGDMQQLQQQENIEENGSVEDNEMFCGRSPDPANIIPRTFDSIESWLKFINMQQYSSVLESHGIVAISQVLSIENYQLKSFGIHSEEHCRQILDGVRLIKVATTPVKQEDVNVVTGTAVPFSNSSGPFIPQLHYLSPHKQ